MAFALPEYSANATRRHLDAEFRASQRAMACGKVPAESRQAWHCSTQQKLHRDLLLIPIGSVAAAYRARENRLLWPAPRNAAPLR